MEIGIPERKQGTIFVPIPVEIISYDAERLASMKFRSGRLSFEVNI